MTLKEEMRPQHRYTRLYKGSSIVDDIRDYTIIDIETTGFDAKTDKIIELAALKIRNNEIVKEYSQLINPEQEIDTFITSLTSITNEMILEMPTIESELNNFLNFIDDDIVIGHNVNFDINFIYDNCQNILNKYFENDFIDTLRISKKCIISDNYKLGTLAKKLNIDYEGAHRALKDCHITYNLYNILKEKLNEETSEIKKDYSKILNDFVPLENNPFKNKNIVFKGTIVNYGYDFITEIAEKCGTNVYYFFDKNIDIVVFGNYSYKLYIDGDGGERIEKARKLAKENKIKVLSEEDFLNQCNLPIIISKKNKNEFKAKDIVSEINEIDENNPLFGKECIFTGTLVKMTRKEAMQIVANLGGKNRDNVTFDTNYLVLGNNDYNPILRGKKSSKLIKAEKLKLSGQDIEIISENVFYDMIEDYIQL